MHSRELKAAGEPDERIFMVGAWREAPYFSDAERAALALTEAATRLADRADPVPDEVWEEAARHYDESQLAGLVIAIAGINAWNRINAATRQITGEWVDQFVSGPSRPASPPDSRVAAAVTGFGRGGRGPGRAQSGRWMISTERREWAATASATLPISTPRQPGAPVGAEHDQARVVLLGDLDDALPGRARPRPPAARAVNPAASGQLGSLGGGLLGRLLDL